LRDQRRLSPTDASLLELEERRGMPLHTGWVLIFDGTPPSLAELTAHVRARLALVPRYGRRVQAVPLRQGRPLWASAPALALEHQLRSAALPGPGGERELAELAGRVFAARLERDRPLWELWLIERLSGERFALIAKSHEALVDGEDNRDLLSVLLDGARRPPEPEPATTLEPARPPNPASPPRLLLEALAERASNPLEALETLRALGARAREELEWHDLDLVGRLGAPPASRLNSRVGPHRRVIWADVGLKRARRAKERLGGTVNDVVLTAVAGALGGYLRAHDQDTAGLILRALVPLADGASGRLLASYAPLPVGLEDTRRRHAEISRALDGLRTSGRARAAGELLDLDGFAPATTIARAGRLAARQHAFNLVVANVPGPQSARWLLGRELRAAYPALPLGRRQALSIAVVSYAGRLNFGLLADYDALPDADLLAPALDEAFAELPKGAGSKDGRERR
jgi:WS/DGAT/MGAT family acyltransferase